MTAGDGSVGIGRRIIRPGALQRGDAIGIFTPSYPAHVVFRDKYLHGREALRALGFRVIEGELTAKAVAEGYRSGSPEERAREFMDLVTNPEVRALIATIGGANSSSLLGYIDFERVRECPKIICGYSDVTALHMALLTQSGLSTFYGPAVVPSFGDWPRVDEQTLGSFLDATGRHTDGARTLLCPPRWSNHFRDAKTSEWCTVPRRYEPNAGWRALVAGDAEGPAIVANLNTLLSLAGTRYFPPLRGAVLILEQMDCRLSREERQLCQLEAMGTLDDIAALVIGKPETYETEGAPFAYDDLLLEVLGPRRGYPVVTNFDCSHTVPMLTIAQMCRIRVRADPGDGVEVTACEPMVQVR
ncbi:S66 peptidase family protein [Sorangium sp. So ce1128]